MGKSVNAGLTAVQELFLMTALLFSTSVKDLNTVSIEELHCDSLSSGTNHLWVTRRVTDFSRRDISDSVSHHSANATPSDKLTLQFVSRRLAADWTHISPGVSERRVCFDCACRSCEWWTSAPPPPGARWGVCVPRGWRQARHVGRWHGRMIPAEGHALQESGRGRAPTWEPACVLFPTDGSAPATGGRRQKTQREKEGDSLWFLPLLVSSLWLLLFIYPLPLPGDPNVANLVFICLTTVVWYCNCQLFRAVLAHSFIVVKCAAI